MKRILVFVLIGMLCGPALCEAKKPAGDRKQAKPKAQTRVQAPVPAPAAPVAASFPRTELPVAENDNPYFVISLGETGVLVLMKQNDLFSSGSDRKIYFYDENLQQRWTAAIETESLYGYWGYEVEEDSLRLVLSVLNEKSPLPDFLEVAVCLADGAYSKRYHSVENEQALHKAVLEGFCMDGDVWHFLLNTKGDYVYYRFSPAQGRLASTPLVSSKTYNLCDAQWNKQEKTAYFLMRDADMKENGLYVIKTDFNGAQVEKIPVNAPQSDLRLVDGKLALEGAGRYLVGGVWNWSGGKQQTSGYDRGTETAGLFTAAYDGTGQISFSWRGYFDFPMLDTLLGSEENYKRKMAGQKANGRLILPDYLATVRFWEQDGHYSLMSETYERVVTTLTDVSYDFYGRMVPYTYTRFEGYRYKNVFYMSVDSSGRQAHTSVFDIRHLRAGTELRPIAAYVQDSARRKFLHAYIHDGVVYYRSLNVSGSVGPLQSFRLTPLIVNDRVMKAWDEYILYWYPGYMLSYGHQQVLNARRKGKNRQNVFYLNKIKVE